MIYKLFYAVNEYFTFKEILSINYISFHLLWLILVCWISLRIIATKQFQVTIDW